MARWSHCWTAATNARARAVRARASLWITWKCRLMSRPLRRTAMKPARLELAAHGVDGDEGDPEPGHDGLLDRLRVAELHASRPISRGRAGAPRSVTARVAEPSSRVRNRSCAEAERVETAPPGPLVIRRDDEHQLVQHSGGEALLAGAEPVSADHARGRARWRESAPRSRGNWRSADAPRRAGCSRSKPPMTAGRR